MKRLTLATAATYSALVTVLFMAMLTIAGEESAAFMAFLKSATGHHWRTKSYADIVLFVLLTLIFYAFMKRKIPNDQALHRTLGWLIIATLVSALAIIGYFVVAAVA